MIIVATKNSMPLSKFIRWVTGEDCSHVAILFETAGLVFHANLFGVKVDGSEHFFKIHTKMHQVNLGVDSASDLWAVKELSNFVGLTKYDFTGLLFLFFCRVFGIQPNKNRWGTKQRLMCQEFIGTLLVLLSSKNIIKFDESLDFGVLTPHEIIIDLKLRLEGRN